MSGRAARPGARDGLSRSSFTREELEVSCAQSGEEGFGTEGVYVSMRDRTNTSWSNPHSPNLLLETRETTGGIFSPLCLRFAR